MDLAGAQLTQRELARLAVSNISHATVVPALVKDHHQWQCQRCCSRRPVALPDGRIYCSECVALGRLTSADHLYRFEQAHLPVGDGQLTWHGLLTPDQQTASDALQASVAAEREHLIWAVTGAGKTEMLFPTIAQLIQQQKRVAIVSPRIDVIRELAPRFRTAFATTPISVRYGGHFDQTDSDLLLATVHQLLRFYRAFDLIVVDEVDAFPMRGTPMLHQAVRQARRGSVAYLTATPDRQLKQAIRRGRLGVSRLFRRFHGHPLPVPRIQLVNLRHVPHSLPKAVIIWVQQVLATKRVCLLFVPKISWAEQLAGKLRQIGLKAAGVASTDAQRAEKVTAFRQGQLEVLVTTTILERGVTVPRCAVAVLAAADSEFSASALIQIAGRAGRAADSPDDPVVFFSDRYTLAMLAARRQIVMMNGR
ncbi:DEAD/DEAH box helicase family protein [Lacticaseibacillus rhamnosus]|uniref:DEAD/DEAH box helicase family protein n=1 Tax=Lacticaseibacillus rhamnosus TaxID=47715 RepID=UPI003DA90CAE